MNLYHIKLTDNQKDALERLFNMGIFWNKTELSEAWEQLREQLKDSVQCVAIINALQDSECNCKKPTAPKYDPCRLFKKGDEVEYRPKDGRANPNLLVGRRYKVSADEPCDSGIVQVEFDGLRHIDTFVAYNNLKLITPIEELDPYFIEETEYEYCVSIMVGERKDTPATYHKRMHPHAKEAAESECARLNAEWRKEQEWLTMNYKSY